MKNKYLIILFLWALLLASCDFKLKPFPNPHGTGRTDGTLATLPCHADCDSSFTALFVRNGGK